jgi:hypothetical protein
MHLKNVAMDVYHRHLMGSSQNFLWIQKKKLDCLSLQTKTIVLLWQVFKTQMIPNRKEVARKRLASHVYDEKLAQYFMETLICFRLIA